MTQLKIQTVTLMLLGLITLNGCGFMAGAAVGGTAAYEAKDKGYEVQSPIKKEEADDNKSDTH